MSDVASDTQLSVRSTSAPPGAHVRSAWYGMWWLIATEAALFGYLLFGYIYSLIQVSGPWPPDGAPSLKLALPNTFILLASSAAVVIAEKRARRNDRTWLIGGLLVAIVLGLIFVGVQLKEWSDKPFTPSSHLYGSYYFTITGFHMAHVVVGLLVLAALAVWAFRGEFAQRRSEPVSIGALYWHFVDAVWLVVFATFYLLPLLR